jgi:hypothetical protein
MKPDMKPITVIYHRADFDGIFCREIAQRFLPPGTELILLAAGIQMPEKKDFIDRNVREPIAVQLAGEYDIWDKRNPDAELFQHGLRSRDLSNDWGLLLQLNHPDGTTHNPTVLELLDAGKALQYAKTKENDSIIKSNGFTLQWEGLTFLACNAARFNSHLFTAGIKPEHEALLGFCLRADGAWTVSLYGVPHRPDVDLSGIAFKYGGGGHRQACGFKVPRLPFLKKVDP